MLGVVHRGGEQDVVTLRSYSVSEILARERRQGAAYVILTSFGKYDLCGVVSHSTLVSRRVLSLVTCEIKIRLALCAI